MRPGNAGPSSVSRPQNPPSPPFLDARVCQGCRDLRASQGRGVLVISVRCPEDQLPAAYQSPVPEPQRRAPCCSVALDFRVVSGTQRLAVCVE